MRISFLLDISNVASKPPAGKGVLKATQSSFEKSRKTSKDDSSLQSHPSLMLKTNKTQDAFNRFLRRGSLEGGLSFIKRKQSLRNSITTKNNNGNLHDIFGQGMLYNCVQIHKYIYYLRVREAVPFAYRLSSGAVRFRYMKALYLKMMELIHRNMCTSWKVLFFSSKIRMDFFFSESGSIVDLSLELRMIAIEWRAILMNRLYMSSSISRVAYGCLVFRLKAMS